jgi:hypothetical protein
MSLVSYLIFLVAHVTFRKSALSPCTTTESTVYPLRIGGALRREQSRRGCQKDRLLMKAAILKKQGDGENRTAGGDGFNSSLRDITQKLLVGLIENEINSAFIFVAVARSGYRAAKFSDGNAALSKAEAIYAQASELARDGCGAAEEAIADRLRELRLAIDCLMSGDVQQ